MLMLSATGCTATCGKTFENIQDEVMEFTQPTSCFLVQVASEGDCTVSAAWVLADTVIDAVFTPDEDLDSFLRASVAKYIITKTLENASGCHEEALDTLTCTCEAAGRSCRTSCQYHLLVSS